MQTQKDVVTRIGMLFLLAPLLFCLTVMAQVGVVYDLKKPPKYENRVLASEKSTERKFPKTRRFMQNTFTHFNYYFNANNKLNEVIARAKASNRDDFTRLLPFYNYSLDATASQKKELDSVIFKCTTGILIHDTRNDWIDNLYMLIGQAFFLRKDFDSAYITFQFLNFAFAPKEKDGYDKPIGSNANADDGGSAFKVSTKEKRNIAQKVFSLPPSRNESLLWQLRTYLEKDQYPEAAALIDVLKHDPQFPPRLAPGLEEMQALLFYKQNMNDSAAIHLEKALPRANGKEELARWEYLIGQLYERARNSYQAKIFFDRAINHTYDPVLEVYARLNSIRQNSGKEDNFIQKNIDALVKMARKDRYETYSDIIYYTAAQIELERNNKPGAEVFLLRSIAASGSFGGQKNLAFLQLANLEYEEKKYQSAKSYYDSLNIPDPALGDISWLPDRKTALATIVTQQLIIERQDSLERIAALPPDQRDAYIKKLVKKLRKQQGLRDEGQTDSTSGPSPFSNNKKVPDLFNSASDNAAWYFYNSSLKAKGYSDFKTKWGNRQNVDNWQVSSMMAQPKTVNPAEQALPATVELGSKSAGPEQVSYKGLLDRLPMTPEKIKISQDSVQKALFMLGKTYQEGLPDYESAIKAYEGLLEKFPDMPEREEILLGLYYCYKKTGDEANANRVLQLMKQKFAGGKFTAIAINPDSANKTTNSLKENATHQYEKIYNSFIEGRFEEALAEKKIADSLYGDRYWTPQLLYIESVYFIRTRQDNQAKIILNSIMMKFTSTPMAAKAANLLDVLGRRKQIEDYLTNLKIERATDDSMNISPGQVAASPARPAGNTDSLQNGKEDSTQVLARAKIGVQPQSAGKKPAPGLSPVPLQKIMVDTASLTQIKMSATQLSKLQKQLDSIQAAIQKGKADSMQTALLRRKSDSLMAAMKKLQADTAQLGNRVRALNSMFAYTPEKPHAVVIVLDNVDPVYVAETKNAFSRYNLENYYSRSFTIGNSSLNDSLKLVAIDSFENAAAALEYVTKAKALAPRDIVPWLPVTKYSFLVISLSNLELLLDNKDIQAYKKFGAAVYPGKF